MIELKVYNTEGKQTGTLPVDESVFGVDYNEALIHQVVVAQLANKRQGTKSTLTRAEVRGGGVKPYRQKGTGRARQGSIRAPQWKKGGLAFAPKPRDFSKKINKKMKEAALKSALSQKIRQDEVIVLDALTLDAPKTKLMANILKSFALKNKTLLVLKEDNETVLKAARNIEDLTTCNAELLNVYEIIRNKNFIITADAVKKLEEENK